MGILVKIPAFAGTVATLVFFPFVQVQQRGRFSCNFDSQSILVKPQGFEGNVECGIERSTPVAHMRQLMIASVTQISTSVAQMRIIFRLTVSLKCVTCRALICGRLPTALLKN